MEILEDKIFEIKKAKFYLPHYPTDSISSCIVGLNNYWDNWAGGAMEIIDKYLKDGSIILDIGANVGSHTLYWMLERNAKKIYSFEPLKDTFDILATNVKLNSLEDRVVVHHCGLSNENCKARVKCYFEANIGGTVFEKCPEGEYEFRTLDSFEIPEHIDMIKIDVEGHEMEVLEGARETILKNKPILVIECHDNKEKLDEVLAILGYGHEYTIREKEDYIYTYKEN